MNKDYSITRIFYACLILLFFFTPHISADLENQEKSESIENVKAAMIISFAKIVGWPPNSSVSDPNTPFRIGVIGNNPVASALNKITRGKKIMGKRIDVLSMDSINTEMDCCNVLFIPELSRKKIQRLFEIIGDKPILTISDSKGYEKRGVMINLIDTHSARLKFNVNLVAAKKSGLHLTSQVVRWAKTIIK